MSTAVILAAGMATRLRPLTLTRPKCLLEIGGRTLLQRTVDAAIDAGCHRIVVVTGYKGEMVREALELMCKGRAEVTCIDNPRYATTNNIYSLYLCRELWRQEGCMLLDSDIAFDPAILPLLMRQGCSCLAVNRHQCGAEEVKVITDPQGMVVEIGKTCDCAAAMGESVGLEWMTPEYTEPLARTLEEMIEGEGLDNVFYELAFDRLAQQWLCMKAIDTTAYYSMEMDTVEDYETVQNSLPSNLR